MLADIVTNQVDITTLQNISPQHNSFQQNESFSINKKSFDDLVQEARQNLDNPVEKNESNEKERVSVENDVQDTKKTSDIKENVTEMKNISENTDKASEKFVRSDEKSVKSALVKLNKTEKTDKSEKIEQKKSGKTEKKEISFRKLEDVLENARKLTSDENEKNALTVDDMKILLEDDQEALAAEVQMSEMLVSRQQEDLIQLPQFSENIFDSENEVSEVKPKVFAFDKDGKIIVKDYRSESESKSEISEKVEGKNSLKITDIKIDSKNNAEITMDLAANVQQNIISSTDQVASADGSNFQAMLSNQIQQNAGEIVKAGSIVLKDNNNGSIKLILHPEALGNVKIDLSISDKTISGKIIVASQEAFNAFKESSENLKQAFLDMGYDSAGLELSFAGQDGNGHNFQQDENPAARFAMNRAYGGLNESASVEYIPEEIRENSSKNSVNIVA